MRDADGGATPPRREDAENMRHILIRGDGWTLGAPAHLLEAAEKLWKEDWVGRVDLINQKCVEFHIKSTHGYWVSMGYANVKDGEPCALEEVPQEREQPKGKTLEDLRDFLRKGIP